VGWGEGGGGAGPVLAGESLGEEHVACLCRGVGFPLYRCGGVG